MSLAFYLLQYSSELGDNRNHSLMSIQRSLSPLDPPCRWLSLLPGFLKLFHLQSNQLFQFLKLSIKRERGGKLKKNWLQRVCGYFVAQAHAFTNNYKWDDQLSDVCRYSTQQYMLNQIQTTSKKYRLPNLLYRGVRAAVYKRPKWGAKSCTYKGMHKKFCKKKIFKSKIPLGHMLLVCAFPVLFAPAMKIPSLDKFELNFQRPNSSYIILKLFLQKGDPITKNRSLNWRICCYRWNFRKRKAEKCKKENKV